MYNQIKSVYLRQNFLAMKLMLISLILVFLAIGCKNKELPTKYLSTISVIRETEENQTVKSQTIVSEDEKTVTPVIPKLQKPVSSTRYHIIVASFGYSEKARAERLVSQLKAKNYPATLITSSQRYRVSIESFSSEQEANAARDEYRTATDRQDIWVHKVE